MLQHLRPLLFLTLVLFAVSNLHSQTVDTIAQPVRSSVETIHCVGGKILMWSGREGPILSTDGGDSYSALCSPEMVARVEKSPNVSFIAHDRIWLTGMDQALVLGSSGYESTDDGKNWSPLTPARVDGDDGVFSSGHLARKIDDEQHSRVLSSYSTDRGATWTNIPIPDSLGSFDLSNSAPMILDRPGVWCIRSQTLQRWFQTSLQDQRWVESDLPSWITTFAVLSDGSRIGVERVGQRSVLHRQVSRDQSWLPMTLSLSDTMSLDTISLSKLISLPDRSVATVVSTGVASSVLLIIKRDTTMIIQPSHIDSSYASIDVQHNGLTQLPVADDTTVLIKIGPRSGRPPRPPSIQCLLNYKTGAIEMLDRTASEISWQVLLNSDLLSVRGRDVQIKYDRKLRSYTYGFELHDAWHRSLPIMFDGIVNDVVGTPWLLTEWGDVGFLHEGRFRLVGQNADKLNRSRASTTNAVQQRTAEIEMRLGSNLLWSDVDAIYVGGAGLTKYSSAGVTESISTDTTTAYIVDADGTRYRAFHHVVSTAPSGLVDSMQIVSDTNIVIGAFVRMPVGNMVAGLRGYRMVRDGQPIDTTLGGLYYSSDGGKTWTQATVDLEDAPVFLVHSVSKQPNGNILWASVTSADLIENTFEEDGMPKLERSIHQGSFYLLRSTDEGASWTIASTANYGGSWLSSGSGVSFYSEERLAWTTNNRILISDDGGDSFVDADLPLGVQIGGVQFDHNGDLVVASSHGILKVSLPTVRVDEPTVRTTPAFWANTAPNPTDGRFTVRVYNIDRAGGRIDQLKIVDILGRTKIDLIDRLGAPSMPTSAVVEIPVDLGRSTDGLLFLVASSPARSFIWPIRIGN